MNIENNIISTTIPPCERAKLLAARFDKTRLQWAVTLNQQNKEGLYRHIHTEDCPYGDCPVVAALEAAILKLDDGTYQYKPRTMQVVYDYAYQCKEKAEARELAAKKASPPPKAPPIKERLRKILRRN